MRFINIWLLLVAVSVFMGACKKEELEQVFAEDEGEVNVVETATSQYVIPDKMLLFSQVNFDCYECGGTCRDRFEVDVDGNLWFLCENRLVRWDKSESDMKGYPLDGATSDGFFIDSQNRLHMGRLGGSDLSALLNDGYEILDTYYLDDVAEDDNGGIWTLSGTGGTQVSVLRRDSSEFEKVYDFSTHDSKRIFNSNGDIYVEVDVYNEDVKFYVWDGKTFVESNTTPSFERSNYWTHVRDAGGNEYGTYIDDNEIPEYGPLAEAGVRKLLNYIEDNGPSWQNYGWTHAYQDVIVDNDGTVWYSVRRSSFDGDDSKRLYGIHDKHRYMQERASVSITPVPDVPEKVYNLAMVSYVIEDYNSTTSPDLEFRITNPQGVVYKTETKLRAGLGLSSQRHITVKQIPDLQQGLTLIEVVDLGSGEVVDHQTVDVHLVNRLPL